MKKITLLFALYLAIFLAGCYNRFTGNYDEFPDINNLPSGVVDQAGLTDEDKRRQLEFLKQLDAQKEPVYRINAGDKISIRVYNHPDLIMESLVTPDGAIGVMFAGQVQVAGLTLEEASEKIKKVYAQYIKNPELGVFAIDVRSQTATIAGAVNNPGMFVISNGMRLADLFAKAGGSAVRDFDDQMLDAADYQNSILVRDGKILPVNFSLAIEKGDRWHNVKLKKATTSTSPSVPKPWSASSAVSTGRTSGSGIRIWVCLSLSPRVWGLKNSIGSTASSFAAAWKIPAFTGWILTV